MAVLEYPSALGYTRWHAWRDYSSETSPFLESEFAPAALPVPVRPIGVLLWRGEFATPLYGPRDIRWINVRQLMEAVDHGINQLLLPVPQDQQSSVLGSTITVQPIEVRPPVRGSRGQTAGWTVTWVEVP